MAGRQFMVDFGRRVNKAGEVLCVVKGGEHYSGYPLGYPTELGLFTPSSLEFQPDLHHEDVKTDSTGREVAADVMTQLAAATLRGTLIHFDPTILELVYAESMAMGGIVPRPILNVQIPQFVGTAGAVAPAGTLMGGRKPMYASGNHFISVSLYMGDAREADAPYRFRQCYLTNRSLYKLGTTATAADVTFRCLPCFPQTQVITVISLPAELGGNVQKTIPRREQASSGGVVWDRLYDTSGLA